MKLSPNEECSDKKRRRKDLAITKLTYFVEIFATSIVFDKIKINLSSLVVYSTNLQIMPRVIERFGGRYGSLGRCIMFIPLAFRQLPVEKMIPRTYETGKGVFKWFNDYNCTFLEGTMGEDFFSYSPNGTYSGPLGMIQRGEVDVVPYVARPDALPHNPGLIGQ
jgi:hypothetical protein